MTLYGADELVALRAAQVAAMADSCQIGTVATAQDSIGDLVAAAPAFGAEIACGLQMLGGDEGRGPLTVVSARARLRLPHGTAVSATSVVRITKRQGTAITALEYEVVGEPQIGASGVVCELKKVST